MTRVPQLIIDAVTSTVEVAVSNLAFITMAGVVAAAVVGIYYVGSLRYPRKTGRKK